MPKILCKCGQIISYSEIPSKNDWLFISDVDYDEFQGKIDSENLYHSMKIFRKCINCGRLYIYWNGVENEPEIYAKES